ncbi:MAG: cation transporter [Anaerolineales bacterium]|nr:cation transporter [Anaerolineales bacterium]MCW5856249.1 cation transporter [Anaerolineales bacterium]
MERSFLTRYAWLSIAAAVATIALKTTAYWLTDSVGLLSDAVESLVNLAGGVLALVVLNIAAQPPDEEHAYGHSKAEYFSSGVEGGLILLAAVSIAWAAIQRLLYPQPLEDIGLGLAVSVTASLINLGVALVIRRAGQRHNSPALQANSQHLLTDVWTSAGVLLAVGLVALSGWGWLDPVVALIVALNITWTGYRILRQSTEGLMDTALPAEELSQIQQILDRYTQDSVQFHALRTRQSGARRFVSMHVLVPGDWSVRRGHGLLEQLEGEIRASLENATVFTHLEALEDAASWDDQSLDRS